MATPSRARGATNRKPSPLWQRPLSDAAAAELNHLLSESGSGPPHRRQQLRSSKSVKSGRSSRRKCRHSSNSASWKSNVVRLCSAKRGFVTSITPYRHGEVNLNLPLVYGRVQ